MAANNVEPSDCGICGDVENTYAFHWNSPFGSTMVAISCSEAHGELIESSRDENRRLTKTHVRRARQAWKRAQARKTKA